MNLNASVDVNFARVDVIFKRSRRPNSVNNFSFILIPISIKVLLILHTKFQPNIPSHFGDVNFSNGQCDLIPL